ncbi:MAG: 2-oxoacid:acceptor oxidoreductase family protein, partial [Planctomycetota bacterium]
MTGQSPPSEQRLIVAGFGGQGVLTLGKILCMAAMREGKKVAYLPSYGAEVRGGTANCQVVVSQETIYSPLVEEADSLIILNQLSYDRFAPVLKAGGLLLLNCSLVAADTMLDHQDSLVLPLPVTEMAAEMGEVRVANVILLGAFVQLTGLVRRESCLAALEDLFGQRKAELMAVNTQALARGAELAAKAEDPVPSS